MFCDSSHFTAYSPQKALPHFSFGKHTCKMNCKSCFSDDMSSTLTRVKAKAPQTERQDFACRSSRCHPRKIRLLVQASCSFQCSKQHCIARLALSPILQYAQWTQAKAQEDKPQSASNVEKARPPPWSFGFQTNERHLQWDESAQRQLLKMHVANKLDKVTHAAHLFYMQSSSHQRVRCNCMQEVPWVEDKLQEVVGIIPDLSGKIDRMKANIVLQLITDTQASSQTTHAVL